MQKITVIGRDEVLSQLLCDELQHHQYQTEHISNIPSTPLSDVELVMIDLDRSSQDPLQLLRQLVEKNPKLPILIMISNASLELIQGAIQLGAHSYLEKPFNQRQLYFAIQKALEFHHLRQEMEQLRRDASDSHLRLPENGIVMEDVERGFIVDALERTHGNQCRAARLLGLTRHTLRYRMEKFGLLHHEATAPSAA